MYSRTNRYLFAAGGSSRRSFANRRRGVILPVIAILLVAMVAILALVMDLGQVAVYRAQLQNAADSAALAGASALGTDNLIRSMPSVDQSADMTAARQRAEQFAELNSVNLNGTVKVVLDAANDVDGGTLANPSDLTQGLAVTKSAPMNSIRVRTYANDDRSGSVRFLFAPVFNMNSSTVQASGTATVELHRIESFRLVGNRSPILPITMTIDDWQAMVDNKTGLDSYRFDQATGKIVPGSDGLAEQQLYPGSVQSPSNKGLLEFGVDSHSNSVLSDEIVNGPTQEQLLHQWPNTNGAPDWSPQHTLKIGADPGWRAANFDDLATVAASGLPRLIPINDGKNPGNGANGSYTILMFAPVRVVMSYKGGNGKGYARVQPAVITDPSVVGGGLSPPGEGGVPIVRLTR